MDQHSIRISNVKSSGKKEIPFLPETLTLSIGGYPLWLLNLRGKDFLLLFAVCWAFSTWADNVLVTTFVDAVFYLPLCWGIVKVILFNFIYNTATPDTVKDALGENYKKWGIGPHGPLFLVFFTILVGIGLMGIQDNFVDLLRAVF